jgi:hypothetical protein
MNLVILIRRSENWGSIISTKELRNGPPNLRKGCWNNYEDFIQMFDKTMSIGYFQYRQKLKDIAIKNMQATGIPIVTDSHEFLKNNRHNKDLFVIPTDDDDWLHPDIRSFIEAEIKEEDDYISWETMICNDRFFKQTKVTPSNGYAIRCSKATLDNFLDHTTVKNDNKIDRFLSLYIRHSAAIHPIAGGNPKVVLPEIIKYLKDVPDKINWAQPYLDDLNEIGLVSRKDLLL